MRSRLYLSIALVVATIALAPPPPLRAQDVPTMQLHGGLGLDVIRIRDGSRFTPDPILQFGVVRQAPRSRFGVRLDATYSRNAGSVGSSTTLGASVALMYDVGAGVWRPYALGGVGVYARGTEALIAGLGLRRAIGSVQAFGELRYHYGPNRLPLTFGIRF